jgi:hypothetical protein
VAVLTSSPGISQFMAVKRSNPKFTFVEMDKIFFISGKEYLL